MNKQELIDFETKIADSFNAGEIRYPVHLSDGNEEQLIEIFSEVMSYDWIFGSWRMHYQSLLKGVPKNELEAAIRRGESMTLRFPEYKVYGSAIVGGIVPIALGAALSIKREGGCETVWCFMGDMTARTGIALESMAYAANFELPIRFVIEDNGVSVCTPTSEVCGQNKLMTIQQYEYQSRYPHCGAGKRVQF